MNMRRRRSRGVRGSYCTPRASDRFPSARSRCARAGNVSWGRSHQPEYTSARGALPAVRLDGGLLAIGGFLIKGAPIVRPILRPQFLQRQLANSSEAVVGAHHDWN